MSRKLLLFIIFVPIIGLAKTPDWTGYDELLGQYVHEGTKHGVAVNLVDYPGLESDPRFKKLISTIRQFPVTTLDGRQEKLAFYINAYNILTVQLIIEHWPVDSIRDIGGFFSGPWDIVMLENADGELTLDNIEHDIIRSLGERRIHFAVNCASVGCPDLRREAYRADRLDAQLEAQTRKFLHQQGKGITVDNGTVRVSSIFDWYEEDFGPPGVKVFVQRYRSDLAIERIKANIPYDWSINAR